MRRLYQFMGVAIGGLGLIELARVATGQAVVPQVQTDAMPMEPWVALSLVLIGIALFSLALRRDRLGARRWPALAAAIVLLGVLVSLLAHFLDPAPDSPFRSFADTRLLGLATLGLGAAALLLTALRRGLVLANALALAVALIGGTVVLGFLYGGNLFVASDWPLVNSSATIAAVLVGLALLAANGPGVGPTRLFVGDSVRAQLMRWLLPLVAVLIVVTDLASNLLFADFSPGMGTAVNTVWALAIAAWATIYVGGLIDERLNRATRALRTSEEKFSLLFESAPVGIALSTVSEGRLVDVNDEFARILGYQREEIVGRTSVELGLVHGREIRDQLVEGLIGNADAPGDAEATLWGKGGRARMVRLSGRAVTIEGEPLVLSSVIDITEKKAADEALQRSEHAVRELVEGVRDVVFSLTADGVITSLNPAFERLTGQSVSDWIGRPYLDLIHPEDADSARQQFVKAVRSRSPLENSSIRVQGQPEYLLWETSLAPRLEDGELVGFLGIGRDISERANLEEQLRQSQKMEAIGRLAGGIAHDFNNLLTVILGLGQMLEVELPKGSRQAADLDEIVKAGQRAAELTQQLLTFSRQQKPLSRHLELNDVITGVERMLTRMIGEDVKLITDLQPNLGLIKADRGHLEQVLANLAVNARDAMPQGGTLTLSTERVELDPLSLAMHDGAQSGPHIRLRVADTGVGMPEEVKQRIFEPFFTTKEAGKGTGLGLSTVFGIVRSAGGFVTVESEPGHGTAFELFLPVEESGVAAGESTAATVSGGGTETILLVEDNASIREVTHRMLERRGYRVLVAEEPRAAIRLAEDYVGSIDLLLTDVVMPEMSGPAVAEALTRVRPDMRVLFASGYPDDVLAKHGLLESAREISLAKPYTEGTLAAKVREILERARQNA